MDNIRIIFILPTKYSDESEASDVMLQAYEACKQNVRNVTWVKENNYESIDLGKTDFVIFEDFSGINYEKLKETKCARILGPWCVAICLMEGKPIPNFPWPIYNVAMSDCIVACSFLPKKLKLQLKEKIQKMGGCYTETLMSTNTHLITDSVQTEKYSSAAEMGVKIMLPDWIDVVWKASQSANIHCNNEEYNTYKVPPFHNLTICSTGFTKSSERSELTKLVTENGGKLVGKLNLSTTDILVCKGVEGSTSEKYKAARNSTTIKCVTIDWITDSIEKGYALPHNLYPVKKAQSTPTKGNESINPNFSVMSAIIPSGHENRTSFEDTVLPSASCEASAIRSKGNKRKGSLQDEYGQLIDNLDIKKAKKAGQYLDGCSVYVAGFESEHREKLCKVLNLSGATRYDDISDRVTHVIVGDVHCHDVKIIRSRGYTCVLVTVKWLLESIEKQQPANEEDFLINTSEAVERRDFSSPLSKKSLKLLKSDKTITEMEVAKEFLPPPPPVDEPDLVQQYLGTVNTAQEDTLAQLLKNDSKFQSIKDPDRSEPRKQLPIQPPPEHSTQQYTFGTMTEDDTSQPCDIFEGLKFLLVGFEDEENSILKEQIESVGGEIVPKSFKGVADYAVLPIFNSSELRQTTTEVVNDMWITECIQEGEMREILYYHMPFVLQETNPLEKCVITCSGYCSYERNFLRNLIVAMGGICQDQFARITSVEKNIIGSTHLISLDASGKKYMAALKWNLPVVTKDWLLECARTGMFISEKNYLLGDAKAPERADPVVPSVSTPKTVAAKNSSILKSGVGTPSAVTNISTPKNTAIVNQETPGSSRLSRVLTPINQKFNSSVTAEKTPVNKNMNISSEACSQVTPVHKIMQEVRKNNLLGTPENSPVTYDNYFNIKTPDTPLERFLTPNPNKELRKQLQRYINQFPDFVPPQPRRLSTPMSELKKRLWDKITKSQSDEGEPKELNFEDEDQDEPMEVFEEEKPENPIINNKLQLLENLMSSSTGNRRGSRNFQSTVPTEVANAEIKDSQAFTVGWDYRETMAETPKLKIFMISGIDNDIRQSYVEQLERLGAIVSELTNYDPSCTHLICPKPARNEKTLSCMAAGKWILHSSYVEKSVSAGKFLNEEEFEFGNPKSTSNINIQLDRENEARILSMHWWRKEISRRGYGAFNDMRAIVVAAKREPIVRVIEAGGGVVIDMSPPFDDTVTIHATHCLLEPRIVNMEKMQDYIPLAKQGIYCVNTLYISDFLHRTTKDIRDCILPPFAKYYDRN